MTDFLLNIATGDLDVSLGGDFVLGESTTQEAYLNLASEQGEWKQYPLMGGGMGSDVNRAINPAGWARSIKLALEQDGIKKTTITATTSRVIIKAQR